MTTRRSILWFAVLAIVVMGVLMVRKRAFSWQPGEFQPPNKGERAAAVGFLSRVPKNLRPAFDPDDDSFSPIPKPGPSDWLANHHEPGQSFERYQRSRPNRPDKTRNTIYLQPIGDFTKSDGPSLELVANYAKAFFAMPVEILPAVSDEGLPVTQRENGGRRQLLSTDILQWLQPRVPQNAYCLLAVTMIDLYPDPKWNYVFGQASLRARVGVYSFIRYSPKFWGEERNKQTESLMLRRSCNVLAHETGHMFGIQHCVHFHCVMNGSNHLDEADAQPNHLCPVCLRKMQWAKRFDVVERYRNLKSFADDADWKDESRWLEQRIEKIGN